MKIKHIRCDAQNFIKNIKETLAAEGKVLCSVGLSVQPQSLNTLDFSYFDTEKKEIFVEYVDLDMQL